MSLRLAIVLLCFAIAPAHSQIGFGPEIGVGLSTFRFAPATYPVFYTSGSASAIVSGKIGGLIDVPLNRHIFFQAGAYLSAKGGERRFSFYDSDTVNESVKQTLHFTYAEAPLTVVVKTSEQGYGRFIFGLGAVPAYMIRGSYKIQDKGATPAGPFDVSSSGIFATNQDVFNSFDIGVLLSAGYEIPGGMFVRTYFQSGTSNLSRGTELTKNRMFGVSAGYIMGKGRSIKRKKGDLIDITPD